MSGARPDGADPAAGPDPDPAEGAPPTDPALRGRWSRPGPWVMVAAGAFLAFVAALTVIEGASGDPEPAADAGDPAPDGTDRDGDGTGRPGPPTTGAAGSGEGASEPGDPTVTATPRTAATAPPDAPATSPPTSPTTSAPARETGALDDGRHAAYLAGLEGGELEIDRIRLLTGEAAVDAYLEDHPDDVLGPPGEHYIVNDDPGLRTVAVPAGTPVTVLDPDDGYRSRTIRFDELAGYVSGDAVPGDDRMIWPAPFWLTVEDGTVVAMEEQFVS